MLETTVVDCLSQNRSDASSWTCPQRLVHHKPNHDDKQLAQSFVHEDLESFSRLSTLLQQIKILQSSSTTTTHPITQSCQKLRPGCCQCDQRVCVCYYVCSSSFLVENWNVLILPPGSSSTSVGKNPLNRWFWGLDTRNLSGTTGIEPVAQESKHTQSRPHWTCRFPAPYQSFDHCLSVFQPELRRSTR